MTSTSRPESTSTSFRSRTSPPEIYSCKNLRMRRTSSNLQVFDLQSYDVILKQLRHLRNNSPSTTDTTTTRSISTTSGCSTSSTNGRTTGGTTSSSTTSGTTSKDARSWYASCTSSSTSRPQAATIIDLPHTDEHPVALGADLVDISVDSGILQIKKAIASELHSLGKKNIYSENLTSTPLQKNKVVTSSTRWIIRPRPSSTSGDDIDETSGLLKARFFAKGHSQ